MHDILYDINFLVLRIYYRVFKTAYSINSYHIYLDKLLLIRF